MEKAKTALAWVLFLGIAAAVIGAATVARSGFAAGLPVCAAGVLLAVIAGIPYVVLEKIDVERETEEFNRIQNRRTEEQR